MAVVQTGSNLDIHVTNSAASGTVSSTITVPSDATFMVVGVSAYHGAAVGHAGMTFTKGGADTPMTSILAADNAGNWQTAMFYLVLPDTGTNKALKWNWASSSADSRMLFSITFWKGVDTTTPVRDSKGAQGLGWPRNTPPLTVFSGDTIAAFAGYYYGGGDGTGSVTDWNNLTEIAECATSSAAEATWAKTDIASGGNIVVGVQASTGSEGGIAALVMRPTGAAGSTIVQTGSVQEFPVTSTANTGTVSSSITVPADAELVVVAVSAYTSDHFGLAGMTFTKGGVDTAMVKAGGTADENAAWMGALFYQVLPDTGTNKVLKWDWSGTGASSDSSMIFSVRFWKGIDTASPVRSSTGAQTHYLPLNTPSLTAQSGDLIIAAVGFYNGLANGSGNITGWDNLIELAEFGLNNGYSEGAWATGNPSGNTTVGILSAINFDGAGGGGLAAFVFKPAAVVAGGSMKYWSGSAWTSKPLKYWSGSAWVSKPVKYWTGSAWVKKP